MIAARRIHWFLLALQTVCAGSFIGRGNVGWTLFSLAFAALSAAWLVHFHVHASSARVVAKREAEKGGTA